MPDFDIDAALNVQDNQDPVPTCPHCNERMVLDSLHPVEDDQAGFSLKRTCNFVCNSAACDVPENDDRGVWLTEELVVARVTCDLEPMGRNSLRAISSGRCPWCLSIEGPSHNSQQHPPGGLYLTWDCGDCENHWEEHLEVTHA